MVDFFYSLHLLDDAPADNDTTRTNNAKNVFTRTIGNPNASTTPLTWLVLGCEPCMPYGPNSHTAALFLELLSRVVQERYGEKHWTLIVKVYNVQDGHYPSDSEWQAADGVILPGSFSSAYDSDEWISTLRAFIQTKIVADAKPTIGICFGHQVLAQSFFEHNVIKVPSGNRAGRQCMQLTEAGREYLGGSSSDIEMYVSHGDMVTRLPDCAMCLGSSERVPIESAAYFCSAGRPFAFTFQAHPEYAASMDLGIYRTHEMVLDAMEKRGGITHEERMKAGQDAIDNFERVQKQCVDTIGRVGEALGWFPAV